MDKAMRHKPFAYRFPVIALCLLALCLAPAADNLRDPGRFGLPAGGAPGDLLLAPLPSGTASLLPAEKRPRPPGVDTLLAVTLHPLSIDRGRIAYSFRSDPGFDVPPSADRPALPIRSPPHSFS
jgi:hypothetical protein